MIFDSNLPNHFFFKNWKKPKAIKYLHPFTSERGAVNKDKVYSVVELEYQDYKLQICIDGEKVWIKKC
jgi:hypothetical protein